jgi:hypothetical protein
MNRKPAPDPGLRPGSRRLPALLFLAVVGCGGPAPIAPVDVGIDVTADADSIAVGSAFHLTVTRVWRKDLIPGEWSDGNLAPLTVELLETRRREDGERVEEVRRYRAFAFVLEDVEIPSIDFRARPESGGRTFPASAEPLSIAVRPSLDPDAPGPPAPPPGPLSDGLDRLSGVAALALLFIVIGAVLVLIRRRPAVTPAPPATTPLPGPDVIALAHLARLRDTPPDAPAADVAWHDEAARVLRDYLADRFGMPRTERTTEEYLDLLSAEAPTGKLRDALRPCDIVKFARRVTTAAEREALLDSATAFVRESTYGAAS